MRRFFTVLLALLLLVGGIALWVSRPRPLDPATFAGLEGTGDAENGRIVFLAAGCASCHAKSGAEVLDDPVLSGGRRVQTAFGTFSTPNISPDPVHGIGGYSVTDLADVLLQGVTPSGRHVYPAMPYTSYTRMRPQDIADLKAYLDTLPADDTARASHSIGFPYSIRRWIGLWKELYLNDTFVAAAPSPTLERGRYLVEAMGHCAECHTPRNRFGGLDRSRWMAGAPSMSGREQVPNITPAALDWSLGQIAWYLESGFNPSHEEAGLEMADVVANLSQLSDEDRDAIAAYLAGLAPVK